MLLSTIACLLVTVGVVQGYGSFRADIPNGDRVWHPCKPNTFWNGVGHLREGGGGARNAFGSDFHDNNKQWTYELCMMDSDGDGQTNGQELGDPDCVWTPGGIPSRTEDITHPGICTPFYSPQCQAENDWVDCTKEEFVCEDTNRADVKNVTLKFPPTPVPTQETTYKCMIFDVPSDLDYHLIAYKAEIDNDNVMHHILLYGCGDTEETVPEGPYDCNMGAGYNCRNMIGGWTVGFAGHCLNKNFGMVFGKSKYKRMAIEFHWNNPKLETNYMDGSGLTLFYTSILRPNNGSVLSLGQNHLAIPPGREATTVTATCPSDCTAAALKAPIHVASAINHMHYLGSSQSVEHRRNGTRIGYITNEPAYSYDDPAFHYYDPPVEILPYDELITTCTFKSTYSKHWVYYGDGTSDEMCYAFLWFYPAEAMPEPYCQSWKSINVCALSEKPVLVNGCNAFAFVGLRDQNGLALMGAVDQSCKLSTPCSEDCRHAIIAMREHPCMRGGDITDYIVNMMERNKDGLEFLRKMDMCDDKDDDKDDVVYPSAASRVTVSVVLAVMTVVLKLL